MKMKVRAEIDNQYYMRPAALEPMLRLLGPFWIRAEKVLTLPRHKLPGLPF